MSKTEMRPDLHGMFGPQPDRPFGDALPPANGCRTRCELKNTRAKSLKSRIIPSTYDHIDGMQSPLRISNEVSRLDIE